jgi:hypothetical protein
MSQNIKNMLETVESIFNAAEKVLSAMNDGDRTQVKELAKNVGLAVSMEPKLVLHFVNHFVHNTDIAYVTRGKKGGVIKGPKPVKVDKKATSITSTDSPAVPTDIDDLV